jgi:hypothetical protein
MLQGAIIKAKLLFKKSQAERLFILAKATYSGVTKILTPNSVFRFDIMPYKCKISNYTLVLGFTVE